LKITLLFIIAFVLVYLFVPLVRRICLRFGFLDLPEKRKIHMQPTPRLGGIALIIAFIITLLSALIIDVNFRNVFYPKIIGLLVVFLLITLLGLWDDLRGIKPIIKLFIQIVIALVLFYFGFRIVVFTNPFGGGQIQLSFWVSLFLTLFWILGVINAINLIDGLDGLATGVVFIAGLSLLFVGLYLKTPVTVVLLSILCGSSLGFLFYNFPPAKIFLGDTGSMFLGLILAITGLVGLQYKVVTAVTLIIPICALVIPIYDTFLAIWRRLLKKSSVFIADKKHLHHRFLELGLTQRQVAVAIYLATIYFGIIAFLFVLIPNEYALLLLLLLGIGLFFGIRTIGFIERKIKRMHTLEKRLNENES
jgi:UDP-GlcNAc:undecaprenyl-phosphate GlcNAc-1-phosphate transferase